MNLDKEFAALAFILPPANEDERVMAGLQAFGHIRARVAELEAWQIAIAEGTAFINRAEGQDGYEVASPQTILSFFEEIAHTLNRYRAALEEIANPDPNALAHHTVARLALEG